MLPFTLRDPRRRAFFIAVRPAVPIERRRARQPLHMFAEVRWSILLRGMLRCSGAG